MQTFVPFACTSANCQKTAYLANDGTVRYCDVNESGTGISIVGLNGSWTGFVGWASGEFIATNQMRFAKGNALQKQEQWQYENLTDPADEALEPVPGSASASVVVIARKNLAGSVPPPDPEKPVPGVVSADVARFDANADGFFALELSENTLGGKKIAQTAVADDGTLLLTEDGRIFVYSNSSSVT